MTMNNNEGTIMHKRYCDSARWKSVRTIELCGDGSTAPKGRRAMLLAETDPVLWLWLWMEADEPRDELPDYCDQRLLLLEMDRYSRDASNLECQQN